MSLETAPGLRPQAVAAVVWHPSADVLAFSDGGAIDLRDAAAGRPLARLSGPSIGGMLGWSSDGTRLAGAGPGYEVIVWDIPSREATTFALGDHEICGLDWSPSGHRLAAASGDLLRVWDTSDGSVVSEVRVEMRIDTIAWSPSSARIAMVDTGVVKLVNSVTAEVVAVIAREGSTLIHQLVWSPDGRYLAGSLGYGGVRVWDVAGRATEAEFGSELGTVVPLVWSRDGSCLAAGGTTGGLGLWDPVTKDLVRLQCHRDGIEVLSWAPDSRRLASTGEGGAVRIWDREQQTSYDMVEERRSDRSRVRWGRDGHLAVVPDDGRSATLWDVEGRRATPLVTPGPRQAIRQVISWSPDGAFLALSGAEEIVVWDTRGGRSQRPSPPDLVAVGPRSSGPALAWAERQGNRSGQWKVKCSTTVTGPPSKVWSVDTFWLDGLSWSPDGAKLAITTRGRVYICSLDNDSAAILEVGTPDRSDSLGSVRWSPDGERLAATYGYRGAIVWDVRTGAVLARPTAPVPPLARSRTSWSGRYDGGHVSSVAWSDEGDLVAAGSTGSTVWHGVIWEAPRSQPRRRRSARRWRSLQAPPAVPAVNWIGFQGAAEVAINGAGHVAVVDRNGWTTVLDGGAGRPVVSVNANGRASAWIDVDGRYGLRAATGNEPPIWVLSGLDRSEVVGTSRLAVERVAPSANPCRRAGEPPWQ